MTTVIRGTDNSAAAPALTGNDGDTGVYFPSAGNMSVACNGTDVLALSTSQIQMTASQLQMAGVATLSGTSVPLTANSTDSNTYKIGLQDNGAARGFLGANSSNALMVADNAGANLLNVTAAGVLQTNSGYGSVAPAYGVRAWVNFNGVSTIKASGNVSSITYSGTGQYVINFGTAMPDTNYSVVGFSDANSGIVMSQPASFSTTLVALLVRNNAGTYFNGTNVGVVVVR